MHTGIVARLAGVVKVYMSAQVVVLGGLLTALKVWGVSVVSTLAQASKTEYHIPQ